MNFRKRMSSADRNQIPTAPMLGIVFLLLMFFMLQLKVLTPVGNPNLNLPADKSFRLGDSAGPHDIKVGLRSDREGNLVQLTLGSKDLGKDEKAFELLNKEILAIVDRPGHPLLKDVEVEIDADFETQYKYVVQAISKCTGGYDPDSKQIARYVEKIKFAPPHKPKS